MRALIVDLGREYRGGQHQALLLAKGLMKRGQTPELVAVRGSELAMHAKEAGAQVHEVSPKARVFTASARIRSLVRAARCEILHANEPHALTAAWLAGAHRAVPVVVSRRIALPLSHSRVSLARYRAAARVIAVSHFVERSVIQSGIAAEKVAVIYDGVPIPPEISSVQRDASRRELGIASDGFCIGNVAAFVPEKGHALLLEAFAVVRAKSPECLLLLRGDGPERANLASQAQRLGIADAVRFLPPPADIEALFAALDVFAFPSHEEPLGSALLAAMAHGLPCVAIARGGVPEIIQHEKTGLLVKDLDSSAFAAAIARLHSHPDEASRLGKAAREDVLNRFSANRMVEETLRLFESALASQPVSHRKIVCKRGPNSSS